MLREDQENVDPQHQNGSSKGNGHNKGFKKNDNQDEEDMELRRIQDENISMIETEQDNFPKYKKTPQKKNFIDTSGPDGKPQMFASSKHIEAECKRIV